MRMICGRFPRSFSSGALVVPERAEHGVDLAGDQGGAEAEAHVPLLHRRRAHARLAEHGLEVRVLVVDPGRADGLALEVGGLADLRLRQRDDRGERLLDDRGHAHHAEALVARAEHLGLVRDREVHAPRRHLLDRRGRVGRLADLHVEAGLLEVATRLRGVDAGVVGVREVVEHQLDALGAGRLEHVLLLAAPGEHNRDADASGEPSFMQVVPFDSMGKRNVPPGRPVRTAPPPSA